MRRNLAIAFMVFGAIVLVLAASARIGSTGGGSERALISANAAAAFRAFCREHCRR